MEHKQLVLTPVLPVCHQHGCCLLTLQTLCLWGGRGLPSFGITIIHPPPNPSLISRLFLHFTWEVSWSKALRLQTLSASPSRGFSSPRHPFGRHGPQPEQRQRFLPLFWFPPRRPRAVFCISCSPGSDCVLFLLLSQFCSRL